MASDAADEYKSSLSDLNCNSKPMINVLTIVAEENIKFAPQIVEVIEKRITEAGTELKLPVLYLIDSIMKNIGRDYLNLFSERIVTIFSSVFEKVDEKTRVLLYKLRQTWTDIVPNIKLYAIDVSVKQVDPAWPITAQPPRQSIHINPEFLFKKQPEESATIRETETKLKAQQEVVKQLLAKQERLRRLNDETKEAERKSKTTVRKGPIVLHVQPSQVTTPVERSVPQNMDPRIAQRDPRLQKSSAHKGLITEDKPGKNLSSASKDVQGSHPRHSPLPSVVLVPNTSSSPSQEVESSVSSKSDKKLSTSDSSKKKADKSSVVENKESSNEKTVTEEPKSDAAPEFCNTTKPVTELRQTEPQEKSKTQDTTHKSVTDTTPTKSKGSIIKEKQTVDAKSAERSKLDSKDSKSEDAKHIGKTEKSGPQETVETEKESETRASRSRNKVVAKDKRISPRHRSRSPLQESNKKRNNRLSKPTTRSSRHTPTEKEANEEVKNHQEPTAVKEAQSKDLPVKDTDLRVTTSASPEKTNKSTKRDNSTFKENECEKKADEPPVKKAKEGENENSERDTLFGNEDQDYRCKGRGSKESSHLGWAQYKAVHPDEFKSPLRPARENMENIKSGKEDPRKQKDQGRHIQYGAGPQEIEFDRLGRPRLNRRRHDARFRGGRGKRYDPSGMQREKLPYRQGDRGYMESMLSNPQFIIRQAEERYRAGSISEDDFRSICDGLQLASETRERGSKMPNYPKYHPSYENEFSKHDFPGGSRMRHINAAKGLGPPPQAPSRIKGPKPMPPAVCNFKLDEVERDIHFIDGKAIVVIDGVPREVVLRGEPTQVYIEGMNPITVQFNGKPVGFEVEGKLHTVSFGVPTRELYVDDYPYQGNFGGRPFPVDIGDKQYLAYLGTPIPRVVILEEPQHELFEKFLARHGHEVSNSRMSPIMHRDREGNAVKSNFSGQKEEAGFRDSESGRPTDANSAVVPGPLPFDVDMRTPMIKKEPEEQHERFGAMENSEMRMGRGVPDMKDVDWRPRPTSVGYVPSPRDDHYPPNVGYPPVKDGCEPADMASSRTQIKSENESNFRSNFPDTNPQMRPSIWNGPMPRDPLEDRSNNGRQDWESNQERKMPWQEGGSLHSHLSAPPHDRLSVKMPNHPDWRGGRFTPPYSRNEPVECGPPPRGMQSHQVNWQQNEGNSNMPPGWEWKQRGFQPEAPVPPMHSRPPDQGSQYNLQRSESKLPFENYRGSYDKLPPPPLPPQGPLLRSMGQLRPEMQPVLRPPMPGNELQNSRPSLSQRSWFSSDGLPPMGENPNYSQSLPPVSGPRVSLPIQSSLPPPPLPPGIPVSLKNTIAFIQPKVQNPIVSEVSSVPPVGQGIVPPFSGLPVKVKTEPVDANSDQEAMQTLSTGSQVTTNSTISQGSSLATDASNTGPPASSETTSDSSAPASCFLDLSTLMERLMAAGIISNKPAQAEKTEAADAIVKTETDNAVKEEPTPPIEFTPESLKGRYPGVVNALFRGTQCASCGMRFKDTHGERYSRHLDWHFRVNRREKDGAKKAFSRKWYYDVEDWIQFEEFEDFEERARSFFELQADEEMLQAPPTVEVPTVPATHGHETEVCVVCGEAFQLLWVEEEEEWHLKDAVREDGQPYHPLCFEDFKKASEVPDTPVEEPSAAPEISEIKEEQEATDKDATDSAEDSVPKDVKTENSEEPEKMEEVEEDASVKEETKEEPSDVTEPEAAEVKEEQPEEAPLEGKPGEEEIIGVITESDLEEEEKRQEPLKESKMVVMQSGGIVMKVRAESIQQPASPAPVATSEKDADAKKEEEESEDEFRPPTPDPRFKVMPPVKKGTELSGLCSIM